MEEIVSNDSQVSNQPPTDEKVDVVKYETHSKLLGQHKKLKENFQEMMDKLAQYEQADAELKEQKLAEEGKFKEALELKNQKINELSEALNTGREREATTWRLQAFYSKLPGKLKSDEYLSHANIEKIMYDPDTMSCDNESVEAVVNDFMQRHSHLVEPIAKPKLPSDSPNSTANVLNKINKNSNPANGIHEGIAKLLGGA